MRHKLPFVAGFAAGYVLGARAGRQRYDQIVDATRAFMGNPKVQQATAQAQQQATDVLGTAAHKAGDVGGKVGGRVASKISEKLPGRGKSAENPGPAYVTSEPPPPGATNGRSGNGAW